MPSKNLDKETIQPADKKLVKETKSSKPIIVEESNKNKNMKKKVEEEEEDDDIEDEDEDDDDDDEDEENEDEDKSEKKSSKEKKPKKTFQELAIEFDKVSIDIKNVETEITEIMKNLKAKEKQASDLERQRNKIYGQFGKSHEEEVKKAANEKPKRKGNKDGGFNKPKPVPPKLIKYLGLEDDVLMTRPKVFSLLNDKFKSDNLKEGQITTLDAKTAKILGKEKGRVIEFTACQSFLAEFYNEAFPSEKKAEKSVSL
jgi:hypothetical protein